jgi:hypothetical protein
LALSKIDRHFIEDFSTSMLEAQEFEQWLYARQDGAKVFGDAFYLELLSADYRHWMDVRDMRLKLATFMETNFPQLCVCEAATDNFTTSMGSDLDQLVFASFKTARRHRDKWWLELVHCTVCGKYWLCAHEERIADVRYFRLVSETVADDILIRDIWPGTFGSYEAVLALAKGYRVPPYLDAYTVAELVAARPSITIAELSALLHTSDLQMQALYEKAVTKAGRKPSGRHLWRRLLDRLLGASPNRP